MIITRYGMAVAQAQYPVAEITEKLRARGINVRFGIHPKLRGVCWTYERIAG